MPVFLPVYVWNCVIFPLLCRSENPRFKISVFQVELFQDDRRETTFGHTFDYEVLC